MANKIFFNMEKYRKSQALMDEAHTKRHFKNDANVFEELSYRNRYYEVLKFLDAEKKQEEAIGKKVRQDQYYMIDYVVAFPLEQFNKNSIDDHEVYLKKFMELLKEEYGMEPLGYEFHLDEGSYDDDGSFRCNPHAHVRFYNYDFKNKCTPTSKLRKQKKKMREMQTKMAKVFEPLGYERGVSKKITKAEHLKKDEYVKKIHKEKLEEAKLIEEKTKKQEEQLKINIEKANEIKQIELDGIKEVRDNFQKVKQDAIEKTKLIDKKVEQSKELEKTLLVNRKDDFQKIVDFVESPNMIMIKQHYDDLDNSLFGSKVKKLISKVVEPAKRLYNTLHWSFFKRASNLELEEEKKKKELKEKQEQEALAQNIHRKVKNKLKNLNAPKPKKA